MALGCSCEEIQLKNDTYDEYDQKHIYKSEVPLPIIECDLCCL